MGGYGAIHGGCWLWMDSMMVVVAEIIGKVVDVFYSFFNFLILFFFLINLKTGKRSTLTN